MRSNTETTKMVLSLKLRGRRTFFTLIVIVVVLVRSVRMIFVKLIAPSTLSSSAPLFQHGITSETLRRINHVGRKPWIGLQDQTAVPGRAVSLLESESLNQA